MAAAVRWRTFVRGALCATLVAFGAGYIAAELRYAANRPMWLDECYELTSVIRSQGFGRLLIDGASGQGSPAPLDFILVKSLDGVRTGVRYFGLPPHSYFRLVGPLAATGAGIFLFFLTLQGPGGSPSSATWGTRTLFAALAVASFLLQPLVVHYAAEMRPYALWMALSLVSSASLLRTGGRARTVSLVALVLLAMTATAAIFQLAAFAAAMLAVGAADGRRFTDILKEIAGLFGLPLAVSLFYCLKSQQWDYPAEMAAWSRFLSFWGSRWWVGAVAAAAVVLCFRRRETRVFAVPSLGVLVVYLIAPGIFWLTKARGMFFAEKQYIYHVTALPLLFATSAFVLSAYGDAAQRRAREILAASAAVVCILGILVSARGKTGVAERAWTEWRDGAGVPADRSGVLRKLLERELPRAFCFTNTPTSEAVANVGLVAEWLPVRYASRPSGGKVVLLEARGDGAEVRALADSCPSTTPIPVARNGLK